MNLAELIKDIIPCGSMAFPEKLNICGITEDSRRVTPGMLFAALGGSKTDGTAFMRDAQQRGAVAILAGSEARADGVAIPVLRVAEPRRALAFMAARYYGAQPEVIVAVTGTNGKTSVASFVRQIWAALGHEAASLGTVGIVTQKAEIPLSHTTPDPVTLHKHLAELASDGVTHLALEASSHGLAQFRLDGLSLAAGAFTNITRDHLDYHKTFEDYLAAKLRLFTELLKPGQPAIMEPGTPGAQAVLGAARARKLDILTVGRDGDDLRLAGVDRQGLSQKLTLNWRERNFVIRLPLPGAFQISNALIAAGLVLALGGEPDAVLHALESLKGAKGRLDYVGETSQGAPVFVDYAHTPDALSKALEALKPYVKARLHVVFGCGGDRDPGKRPLMGEAAAALADVIYVTDDNPRSENPASIRSAILKGCPGAAEIGDRMEAIATAIANLKEGDVLLIAGKGHETGQIVGETVIPFSDHEAALVALRSNQPYRSV